MEEIGWIFSLFAITNLIQALWIRDIAHRIDYLREVLIETKEWKDV